MISVSVFLAFSVEYQKVRENAEALTLFSVAIFPPVLDIYYQSHLRTVHWEQHCQSTQQKSQDLIQFGFSVVLKKKQDDTGLLNTVLHLEKDRYEVRVRFLSPATFCLLHLGEKQAEAQTCSTLALYGSYPNVYAHPMLDVR